MEAFIKPPQKIPFYLKIGMWIVRKVTGRDLLPARQRWSGFLGQETEIYKWEVALG
jgi:hypothetical protein